MERTEQITRADIEAKVAEIEKALQGDIDRAKPSILATGIAVSLVVILIAYLFGRRTGTKRSAVVEVRRI